MKFLIRSLTFSLLVIFLTNCEPNNKNKETDSIGITAENEQSEKVVPVEAAEVKSQIVYHKIPLSGVLLPRNSVNIIAEVSGEIEKVYKDVGDFVSGKDTLARIDDLILESKYEQAKANVMSAENNLAIARMNLEGNQVLFEEKNISKVTFEKLQLAVKNAEAALLGAVAARNIAEKAFKDTRITSPISGMISRKNVEVGTTVSPGTVVFRVVDISSLKLNISIAQEYIGAVTVGSRAKVKIASLNEREFDGFVKAISPEADKITGGFPIEISVSNTNDLAIRAGMSAEIDLIAGDVKERLVVPDYSVVLKEGNPFVYRIERKRAKLVPIEIETSVGGFKAIKSGISEGDTIVTVGMKNLGLNTKVNIEKFNK